MTVGIALVGLLAGQLSKPPEAFDFDEFAGTQRARQPLVERAKRADAAPANAPASIRPGELESGIKGSLVVYGLEGAVRR